MCLSPACAPTSSAAPRARRSTKACALCSNSTLSPEERPQMNTTTYLIVGAGMTGDMAAKGIREHDSDGSITMVGADPNPPYKRPLLTKGLWQGAAEEKVWRDSAEGVELVTGRRVVSLDLTVGTATDDAGEEYSWEKLLLATGARPRQIPGAEGV